MYTLRKRKLRKRTNFFRALALAQLSGVVNKQRESPALVRIVVLGHISASSIQILFVKLVGDEKPANKKYIRLRHPEASGDQPLVHAEQNA